MDILQEMADYWHREHPPIDGDNRHPYDMYRFGLISHSDLVACVTRYW